jgi:hypothetical protein
MLWRKSEKLTNNEYKLSQVRKIPDFLIKFFVNNEDHSKKSGISKYWIQHQKFSNILLQKIHNCYIIEVQIISQILLKIKI